MKSYKEFLSKLGLISCSQCTKYIKGGNTICINNDEAEGIYWYYETEDFIIDIHDLYIKKEKVSSQFPHLEDYMSISSNFLKTANGECFNPYRTLTANTMYITPVDGKTDFKFLLHENFPFLSVGINFKEKMIKDYVLSKGFTDIPFKDIFLMTQDSVLKQLEKLANKILNCTMTSPAAEIYLEAQAKEWLSITIDAFINIEKAKTLFKGDEIAIQNVGKYLDDHYSLAISQDLLEKIAMMSGTKLKTVFKAYYKMSITEYTQRKRMKMAQMLLATSNLDIKNVAFSVGYSSHSRFSTLFKKYNGIYPHQVKQHTFSLCKEQENCNLTKTK